MDVKLIVVGGKHSGQEVPVTGNKFFIGRAEDCQLRPQSDAVSRHHCVLILEEGLVAVRDFGSKNGTCINGQRVKAERELKNGDRLQVGPLEFEVRLSVELAGKKKPKVQSIQEAAVRAAEKTGPDEDVDLSDWLDDGEPKPIVPKPPDTQRLDQNAVANGTTTQVMSAEPTPPAPAGEAAQKKENSAKLIGKFQMPKKPMADSSRSAAADMLKQLFERK